MLNTPSNLVQSIQYIKLLRGKVKLRVIAQTLFTAQVKLNCQTSLGSIA